RQPAGAAETGGLTPRRSPRVLIAGGLTTASGWDRIMTSFLACPAGMLPPARSVEDRAMLRGLLPLLLARCCLLSLLTRPALADERRPRSAGEDFFEKKVRPLLVENCQTCHGPRKQRGGLRLDSRAGVLTGGDSGPAIVPGKPDESLLIKAVHY